MVQIRRSLATTATALGALGLAVTVAASPADAAGKRATLTGQHYICADVNVHSSSGDIRLDGTTFHPLFDIDHFADNGDHAWGTAYPGDGTTRYGWVTNSVFC